MEQMQSGGSWRQAVGQQPGWQQQRKPTREGQKELIADKTLDHQQLDQKPARQAEQAK